MEPIEVEKNYQPGHGCGLASDNPRVSRIMSSPDGWGCSLHGNQETRIILLCAEPGMGKSHLIRDVLGLRSQDGGEVRFLNLEDASGDQVEGIRRFSRSCMSAARGATHITAGIDNLVAADECELGKEARALRRMALAGCDIVAAMRPEAAALAEELPEAICLHSADLALGEIALRAEDRRLWDLSLGIPTLAHCARSEIVGPGTVVPDGRYMRTLADLVRKTLRRCLSTEERQMRLAMMLLGRGTLDDLSYACRRLDGDSLAWLRRDAPLFGINARGDAFDAIPLQTREAFEGCADAFRMAVGDIAHGAEIVARCIEALARRGMYARAAELGSLDPDDHAIAEACASWGCELVATGGARLLRRCLTSSDERGLGAIEEVGQYALMTAEQPSAKRGEAPALLMLPLSGLDPRPAQCALHGQLVRAGRECCADLAHSFSYLSGDAGEPDMLARAMMLHLRVRRLLFTGHFYDACCLLMNSCERGENLGLVTALLADDYLMAQLLSGNVPDEDERERGKAARDQIERSGIARLMAYRQLLDPVLQVLAGTAGELVGIEYGISKAEGQGDRLIQAAFLLAAAVSDIRKQAAPRAHVRASQARALAAHGHADYLVQAADLLDALAELTLGNEGMLDDLRASAGRPSGIRDLEALLAHAYGMDDGEALHFKRLSPDAFPRDLAWLLGILAHDVGEVSERFEAVMPTAWKVQLERTRQAMAAYYGVPPQGGRRPRPHPVLREVGGVSMPLASEKRIRVNILGHFEVFVDGHLVNAQRFQRRKGRELLVLLCAARGHKVRRYEAIESIWGSSDYVAGLHRIYEATSSIRSALGARDHGFDPLTCSKSEGSIALDMELFSCDVDEFVKLARATLDGAGDDKEVMRHAAAMSELLPGGFDVCMADVPTVSGARMTELRLLFADAAVAGSEAALHEGRMHLAARLAREGHYADDLREDAVCNLVTALAGLGRTAEMKRVYETFSRRFIEATKMPPSKRLRALVEQEAGGRGTAEGTDAGSYEVSA